MSAFSITSADEDSREAHLEAPDVEGLVRIRAVREAPDERRHDDRRPARHEPLGEGNREHPRRELLGRRGQNAHQEDAEPTGTTVPSRFEYGTSAGAHAPKCAATR